ncbi:MAG: helix-turn-helix transcriptional regulator [Burkholderiales bacterium]|nr:helix-turn-helix transcriptional regulator [Burkholderiales bacterium]
MEWSDRGATARKPGELADLDIQILGANIRREREKRDLAMSDLAALAGVSKSMLSAIENGQKVSSIVIVARIAAALGVSVSDLLEDEVESGVVVVRCGDHVVIGDAERWERRVLSPALRGSGFEMVRGSIGPAETTGELNAQSEGTLGYMFVARGDLHLTVGRAEFTLSAGDSVCFPCDRPHAFSNFNPVPCVYYMATVVPRPPVR